MAPIRFTPTFPVPARGPASPPSLPCLPCLPPRRALLHRTAALALLAGAGGVALAGGTAAQARTLDDMPVFGRRDPGPDGDPGTGRGGDRGSAGRGSGGAGRSSGSAGRGSGDAGAADGAADGDASGPAGDASAAGDAAADTPAVRRARQQHQAEIAAVLRTGTAPDAVRLMPLLSDADALVRRQAEQAIWTLWARSGDQRADRVLRQAIGSLRRGEHARAVRELDPLIAREPGFAEAWNRRASARFMLRQLDEALADCQAAVALDAGHFGAWAGYGFVSDALGDRRGAVLGWERALKLNPNLDGVRRALREARARGSRRPALVV